MSDDSDDKKVVSLSEVSTNARLASPEQLIKDILTDLDIDERCNAMFIIQICNTVDEFGVVSTHAANLDNVEAYAILNIEAQKTLKKLSPE